jgi:hypothetical protein
MEDAMSINQNNPKGNLDAEGISPEGAEQEQEQGQESESPSATARTQQSATGSGTIKVNG